MLHVDSMLLQGVERPLLPLRVRTTWPDDALGGLDQGPKKLEGLLFIGVSTKCRQSESQIAGDDGPQLSAVDEP